MTEVVGILAYPFGRDFGVATTRPRTLRRLHRRIMLGKANPRPPEYMHALFAEHYPGGRIESTVPAIRPDLVVLLYPDAIGLGFERIERQLPSRVDVRVLNGRRRDFAFDTRARLALRVRRLLYRGLIGEALLLAVLFVAASTLFAIDRLQGRR